MGDIEYGTCDQCNAEAPVTRTYFHYDIKCDCCNSKNDYHFEIVRTCQNCDPKPPKSLRVFMEPMQE